MAKDPRTPTTGCVAEPGLRSETAAVDISGPEILIILAVVALLFGAKKIPELARAGLYAKPTQVNLSSYALTSGPAVGWPHAS